MRPVGAFGPGEIAGHLGPATALVVFGAATMTAVAVIWIGRRRGAAVWPGPAANPPGQVSLLLGDTG